MVTDSLRTPGQWFTPRRRLVAIGMLGTVLFTGCPGDAQTGPAGSGSSAATSAAVPSSTTAENPVTTPTSTLLPPAATGTSLPACSLHEVNPGKYERGTFRDDIASQLALMQGLQDQTARVISLGGFSTMGQIVNRAAEDPEFAARATSSLRLIQHGQPVTTADFLSFQVAPTPLCDENHATKEGASQQYRYVEELTGFILDGIKDRAGAVGATALDALKADLNQLRTDVTR